MIGGIVARRLLESGWDVVVTTRSAERVEPLRRWAEQAGAGARLVGVPVVGAPADWRAAVRAAAPSPPRAVVAAIGGWRTYPDLLDVPQDSWRAALDAHLSAHLHALQAYAPLLAEHPGADPVYVTLNGAAAELPMADAAPISITGAAQRMMLELARVGRLGRLVRFHEVSLLAAVAGDDRNLDPAEQVSPARVGQAVLDVLTDPRTPALVRVAGSAGSAGAA